MAVTLTVTDNADGTGGLASVAGSDPAATNNLYRAAFDGGTGSQSWTPAGSRVGDGTIPIASPVPVPLGYWLWRLDSLPPGGGCEVATAYQNLSDAAERSVMDRVCEAVALRIRSLNLDGLAAVRVLERWLPRVLEGVDVLPACFVCPAPANETYPGLLAGHDDVGYPVLVAFAAAANQDNEAGRNRRTLWREKVRKALIHQRLGGVPGVGDAAHEAGAVFDPALFQQAGVFFSPMVFRFVSFRETRGV